MLPSRLAILSRRAWLGQLAIPGTGANLVSPTHVDINAAREQLGYSPRWTFRDGPLTD